MSSWAPSGDTVTAEQLQELINLIKQVKQRNKILNRESFNKTTSIELLQKENDILINKN